jgi:hypothetical protein
MTVQDKDTFNITMKAQVPKVKSIITDYAISDFCLKPAFYMLCFTVVEMHKS